MGRSNLAGPWGEALAAEYLRKKRYKIIGCNYRCRFGEIDIIAQSKDYLVFVEVKLRKTDYFGQAREYVTAPKQERLRATALMWLQSNPDRRQPRFDVIEVYAPDGIETKEPKIIHLEDAFS